MTTSVLTAAMTSASMVSIALDQPIVRGDTSIDGVQIRKPMAGELRGLKLTEVVQADVDAMIVLLPRITVPPLTEEEVAAMGVADFVECSNQVAGFLPQKGASTGSPQK